MQTLHEDRTSQPRLPWVAFWLRFWTSADWQLWCKELRLQRPVWWLVAAAAVGWWTIRFRGPATGVGVGDWDLAVWLILSMASIVWIPLAIGANAVAPERRLGVLGQQLSLPASAGQQWRAKLLMTFGLTAVLAVLTWTGMQGFLMASERLATVGWLFSNPLVMVFSMLASTALGIFASRHATSSFRAFGLAILSWPVFWFLVGLSWATGMMALVLFPQGLLRPFFIVKTIAIMPDAPLSLWLEAAWLVGILTLLVYWMLRLSATEGWLGRLSLRRTARALWLVPVLLLIQLLSLDVAKARLQAEAAVTDQYLLKLGAPSIDETLMLNNSMSDFLASLLPIIDQKLGFRGGLQEVPPLDLGPVMQMTAVWDGLSYNRNSITRLVWGPYFIDPREAEEGGFEVPAWMVWKREQRKLQRLLSVAPNVGGEERRNLRLHRLRQELALLGAEVVQAVDWNKAEVDGKLWQVIEKSPVAWSLPPFSPSLLEPRNRSPTTSEFPSAPD